VPTPAGGIEADVALFKTYADLIAAPESAVKGKIVVITQPMVKAQDGAGYGVAGISRRAGPTEAAKKGALAVLIRSISTSDSTVPHTGVTAFGDGVATIPSAAIGVPEAEQLERLAAKSTLRIKLKLASTVDAERRCLEHLGRDQGLREAGRSDRHRRPPRQLGRRHRRAGRRHGHRHHHGRRQADRRPAQASQAHHPRGDVRLGRKRRLVGSLCRGPQGRESPRSC
jgi:hypothetical protein